MAKKRFLNKLWLRTAIGVLLTLIAGMSYASNMTIWQALRQSFNLPDQSSHPKVKAQIQWLAQHPGYLKDFADNASPYIFFILEEQKRQRLPGELALLPMIESNYNPFAYSHAGAAGLWQLMPGTGSGLGVKQDWWYDGRRGIISSTVAALNYLKYLNNFFKGNWILAIAAYDSGEGTVQRALRYNQAKHLSEAFWDLRLPRETQAYLPRLLALASVIKYPRHFGVSLPQSTLYRPYFKEVLVGSQIDLTHAAKLAGMTYEELLKLNPGHNRWATAPSRRNTLLLPIAKAAYFLTNLETSPKSKRISWARHQVKTGETLSGIALKEHSDVKLIKQINHLKTPLIKPKQMLLIPAAKKMAPQNIVVTKKQLAVNHSHQIGPHRVLHVVQKNDSVDFIAGKYQVKPAEIRFWNQLSDNKLSVGTKLIIWQASAYQGKRTYTVKAGDTLSQIAQKTRVTSKTLRILNPTIGKKGIIHPKQMLRLA